MYWLMPDCGFSFGLILRWFFGVWSALLKQLHAAYQCARPGLYRGEYTGYIKVEIVNSATYWRF